MLLRRLLHTFPEAPELAARNIIHGTPVVDPRVPAKASFQVMGLGSVLQVQLPSSVELTAKRNSLVGVLGTAAGAASLTSRLQLAKSPLFSLWGGQPVLQQTIVGSSPLTCLIGAENRHLSSVELDGSVDWVVKSPVHAFTGKQLRILPQSGWALRSAAPFSHSLVSGRGLIAWSTPASTVQISVPEGESVLVQKRHLSAFTVDTNASQRSAALTRVDYRFSAPVDADIDGNLADSASGTRFWHQYKTWAVDLLRKARAQLRWFTSAGNTSQFVEIYGPSTVLVSSAAKPPRKPLRDSVTQNRKA